MVLQLSLTFRNSATCLDFFCLVPNQIRNITPTCEQTKICVFKTAKTECSYDLNTVKSVTHMDMQNQTE